MPAQERRVRSLQIAFHNARGLRNSRNELEIFADDHELDALLVSETNLNAGIADPKIRGYELYRSDRPHGPGGGTAIYVRRTLPHYQIALPVLQNLEATAVRIETVNGPLTIISCYHPPQILLRENDITEILDTGASVIAAGDFNCKHQVWGSRRANRNGRILLELADNTDMLIEAPPEPTYYDARDFHADILDIALVKNVPFQLRLHASQALDSDHVPVLMHIGDEANDITNTPVQNINWPRFTEFLNLEYGPVPRIRNVDDLERAAGTLERKITTAMTHSTRIRVEPRHKNKNNVPQWIADLIRAKNLARRLAHRTGDAVDRREANRLGNEVKYALIDHRNDQWERKLESLTAEDNSIWRMAKALRSNKKPLPPIHGTRGLVFSNEEKAEAFADSLELQCRPNIEDADVDHIERIEHQVEDIQSRQIETSTTPTSPAEVRKIIGFLKVKKAPGPDNIPNKALKLLPDRVVALTTIINASLRLCHFPSRWKKANVIFIPKPGKDPKFPQNHRPISLLSSIGKVLEKVILTRLVRVTNEKQILPDEQFGFRPQHSTSDQILHVTEFIAKSNGQRHSTGAIFRDVAKAFDTVWHGGLVYKLHVAGVPLAMVKLINSFLQNRNFHAKIGNVFSTERDIEAGVPQGSVLSPTLYAIFTADIPKPDQTKIALYADDTAILTRSWSPVKITERLQRAVVSLETWFRLWRIDVNPDKSSAILFTRRRFHRPVGEIEMFEQLIPWKNEVRYLGISFDNHLRFNNQVEYAKTRGQMVRGQLNSLVNRRSKMSIKNKITIYRTMNRPSMMYGSAIWGTVSHTQLQKLQVVQNKFLRAAFNAPWFVRNTQLHREANLPTIKEFLLDDARKFYAKAAVHPNPLVRESVNYDENAPMRHKRPQCLLLRQD
jgi:retron-type reverse transcriptase